MTDIRLSIYKNYILLKDILKKRVQFHMDLIQCLNTVVHFNNKSNANKKRSFGRHRNTYTCAFHKCDGRPTRILYVNLF